VDRVRIGNTFRAIRVELRLRQRDVAARAGVSQQTISDLECGRLGMLSIDAYCRIASVLDVDVALTPRWRGPKLDRLLDARHAQLQNLVVQTLASAGWDVRGEYSFTHYRDRGSVDVLGWRAGVDALLIVEVKTEITDLQETLRVLDMKRRIVPIVCRLDGRRSRSVGTLLVLPDASTHRDMVARHAALVASALPARNVAVRNWLREPSCDMNGVWFLRNTGPGGAMRRVQPARRVRVGRKDSASAKPGSKLPETRAPVAGLIAARRPGAEPRLVEPRPRRKTSLSTAPGGVPEKPPSTGRPVSQS